MSRSHSRNTRRPSGRWAGDGLSERAFTAAPFPDVWPALARRLVEESAAPRPRRRRLWVAGASAAVLIAGNPIAYLIPRFQEAVDAMVREKPSAALRGALVADPGLFGLWSAGAFQPIQASTTVDGVTLTILGTYFDSHVTVIPFAVSSRTAPARALSQFWSPVSSNIDAVSWASARSGNGLTQAPALQQYPIYLTDQWGIRHNVQNWSYNAATGQGAFTFGGFPGWLRRAGLRLMLHVGAMEEVSAPQGPFGAKALHYALGPWNVPFTALPPREPALDVSPNVTAAGPEGRVTLGTIQNVPSGSWMTLTAQGAPTLTGLSVHWAVDTPDGRTLEPLSVQGSPHAVLVQWPPLTTAGVYRLQLTTGGRTWILTWRQPGWDPTLRWAQPSLPAPLYQGTSWAAALKHLGVPAVAPPAGMRIKSIRVEAATEPLRHPTARPDQVQVTMDTPVGPVQMTESPAWLTVVPMAATLKQFVAGLQAGSPPGSFRAFQIHGIPAQLWMMPSGPNRLMPVLYLYPSWGSIQIAPAESAVQDPSSTAAGLVAIATELTAPP